MEKKAEIVSIRENFVSYGTKNFDSKDRISLGGKVKKTISEKFRVDGFEVLLGDEGDILLRPVATISSREEWLYKNPEAMSRVQQGIRAAKEGRVSKVVDLDRFIAEL